LQEVVLSNPTGFSQGKNVLNAATSNYMASIGEINVSSTEQKRPIWKKQNNLWLEIPKLQEVFLWKAI
jgi:hypothetical protein